MNIAPSGPMPELAPASNSSYAGELTASMETLAHDPRVVFLGQGVRCAGTFMSTTLTGVPLEKRIELPVAEEMQLGVSIGLALTGMVPVSLYPRFNFLLLAMNQLVNHLDKIKPQQHVIVRVGIGSEKPLNPGPQHTGDLTDAFQGMCGDIHFEKLEHPEQIVPAYREALDRDGATVLVEFADYYQER